MEFSDILDRDSRDTNAILQLNNEHEEQTSLLALENLISLLDSAFFARGVDRGTKGFLIALNHEASYDNPNFLFFKARRESFVYIDRIIVAHSARGQGIAKRLYNDLFDAAKGAGFSSVVCEVNIDPPNPASEIFHAAMGFNNVGEATIHSGMKTVRYLEKFLV